MIRIEFIEIVFTNICNIQFFQIDLSNDIDVSNDHIVKKYDKIRKVIIKSIIVKKKRRFAKTVRESFIENVTRKTLIFIENIFRAMIWRCRVCQSIRFYLSSTSKKMSSKHTQNDRDYSLSIIINVNIENQKKNDTILFFLNSSRLLTKLRENFAFQNTSSSKQTSRIIVNEK